MRIAFLHQPNDPYTAIRIKYFLSKGHKVYSIIFHKKQKQKVIPGVEIIELPFNFLTKLPFLKRVIYAERIKKITLKLDLDVLYIISALNSFYLKASKAKRNFLEIQGSDVIVGPQKFPFLKPFYKTFWKYADGITQDSQLAKEKGQPYMPENMINETIEIGVNFNVFNAAVEKGLVRKKYNLQERPVIFHSRGIKTIYNLETIIESIPKVKELFSEVCFMFTGTIEQLDTKEQRFLQRQHLMGNIVFCDWLDHETEMKYYYKDADLSISVPSSDSSPFSVYEAMAIKTPVIVSDLPWLKDKFTSNEHVITVPARDSQLLAEAIIKLLKKEIQLDLNAAYRFVYDNINMDKENDKLYKLFRKVL